MSQQSTTPGVFKTGLVMAIWGIPLLVLGLPVALIATHGYDFATWPAEAIKPAEWNYAVRTLQFHTIFDEYYAMLRGQHPGFHHGGVWQLCVIAGFFVLAVHWMLAEKSPNDKSRDSSGQLGAARWADEGELADMDKGVELGRNLQTGKSVRVGVEGNLLSIAPPRSGKTSGLVINNLLVPDDSAWSGPAVIVDPKAPNVVPALPPTLLRSAVTAFHRGWLISTDDQFDEERADIEILAAWAGDLRRWGFAFFDPATAGAALSISQEDYLGFHLHTQMDRAAAHTFIIEQLGAALTTALLKRARAVIKSRDSILVVYDWSDGKSNMSIEQQESALRGSGVFLPITSTEIRYFSDAARNLDQDGLLLR